MKIGIDIDDTITNTFKIGMKYAEEFTKNYCGRTYTDINERLGNIKTHRYWQEIFEWNSEEEEQFLKNYYPKIAEEMEIKEEVHEIINQLYPKNEIFFITARLEEERVITEELLRKNHIPFHGLCLARPKLEVCQENGIDIFIDDSYENCKSVSSNNIKTYLMDNVTNGNINDNNIERVYGWNDLYQKLKIYEEEKNNGDYCSYGS